MRRSARLYHRLFRLLTDAEYSPTKVSYHLLYIYFVAEIVALLLSLYMWTLSSASWQCDIGWQLSDTICLRYALVVCRVLSYANWTLNHLAYLYVCCN